MTELLDKARPPREGEAVDAEKLGRYLAEQLPELGAGTALEILQFPSGNSNLTYLIAAGEREYVLRRPPFGSKVKTAHDMGREYRILSRLRSAFPKLPEPLLHCDDVAVLGAPFYIMRRIPGIILRKDLPQGLEMSPAQTRALHEALIDTLAELHAVDFEAAGLGDLGKPEGYVQRQVEGWSRRYVDAKTDDIPAVDRVAAWLAERLPAERGAALIHNDYKLDNVVLDPEDPTRIVGILDWEMSTLGDPLMDLGTTLSYWVDAGDGDGLQNMRMAPTTVPGSMTRKELVARYEQKSGREVEDALFYYVFGLFKTAVVVQQIYYRYAKGLTKDARFSAYVIGVHVLATEAAAAIDRGSI